MCRLEHYSNCDLETKNREYCIFHKPNKTETEDRTFWDKFLNRFNCRQEDIIFRDDRKDRDVKIKRLIFEDYVNCQGYIFPKYSSEYKFTHAIFKNGANFDNTIFEGLADFRGAEFLGEAVYFRNAHFMDEALFRGCEFKSEAWFNGAIFEKLANFDGAIFRRDVVFAPLRSYDHNKKKRTLFKSNVGFFAVIFEGKADFSECLFEGELSLEGSTIRRNVINFEGAEFKFPNAEAEASRFQRLDYERRGKTDDSDRWFVRERRALRKWRIHRTSFPIDKKVRVKLLYPHVRNCYEKLLSSGDDEIKYNESEKERLIKELTQVLAEKLKYQSYSWYSCEGLIESMNKLKRINISKILKLKFKKWIACLSVSLEYLLADLTCEYGTNWKRPVYAWVFVVLFLYPFLYFITQSVIQDGHKVYDLLSCLYFSIVTATTLGYGDIHPAGAGRVLASIEAVFGTFMWAVFLTVFARKYMR